jgi:hypothetical protein
MQEKSRDAIENFSVVYYVKFKLAAPKMRPLCQEIESRSHQRPYISSSFKFFVLLLLQLDILTFFLTFIWFLVPSYATLGTDCYSVYFQQRRVLLEGEVYRKLLTISQSGDINLIVCYLYNQLIWGCTFRREKSYRNISFRYEWDVRI